MTLIGSIHFLENRLGGRKHGQGKAKSAQKLVQNNGKEEKGTPAESSTPQSEYETRLGRKIDITA